MYYEITKVVASATISIALSVALVGCFSTKSIEGGVETVTQEAINYKADDQVKVTVTGRSAVFLEPNEMEDGRFIAMLVDSNDEPDAYAQCFFSSISDADKAKLRSGDRVTVTGMLDGSRTEDGMVTLNDCKID